MVYTKTSVIVFASQEDADLVNSLKVNEHVAFVIKDGHPPSVTTNGNTVIVRRDWATESSASAWVQFITKLADNAGVTLDSTSVIDYI